MSCRRPRSSVSRRQSGARRHGTAGSSRESRRLEDLSEDARVHPRGARDAHRTGRVAAGMGDRISDDDTGDRRSMGGRQAVGCSASPERCDHWGDQLHDRQSEPPRFRCGKSPDRSRIFVTTRGFASNRGSLNQAWDCRPVSAGACGGTLRALVRSVGGDASGPFAGARSHQRSRRCQPSLSVVRRPCCRLRHRHRRRVPAGRFAHESPASSR